MKQKLYNEAYDLENQKNNNEEEQKEEKNTPSIWYN